MTSKTLLTILSTLLLLLLQLQDTYSGPPPPPPGPSHPNFEEDQGVIILRRNNMEKALKTFSHLLVVFQTPWCLQCRALNPEFTKAALSLKAQNSKVRLGRVDCALEREVCAQYQIKEYPTVKFFLNGQESRYTGGRTEVDIVNWVGKTTKNPYTNIENLYHIDHFIAHNDAVVIFWGDMGTPEFQVFENLSREVPDLPFLYTTSIEVERRYKDANVLISIIRNFEEPLVHYGGQEFTTAALKSFIRKHKTPLVMDFQDKYTKRIFGDKNPLFLLVVNPAQPETRSALNEFYGAAQQLKGKIYMATVAKDSDWGHRMIDFLGGPSLKLPLLAIVKPLEYHSEKFIYRGDLNTSTIMGYYESYIRGRLSPSLRTAPTPNSQTGLVRVLVGKTYKDIVNNQQRDVFVFLYAPWCEHSRMTEPVWDELSRYVSSIRDLLLAKMDVTTNEIEGLPIANVPHILFYPANNKTQPILFKGHRTLSGFWNWLKDHITVSYDPSLLKEIPQETDATQSQPWNNTRAPQDINMPAGVPGMTPMMAQGGRPAQQSNQMQGIPSPQTVSMQEGVSLGTDEL